MARPSSVVMTGAKWKFFIDRGGTIRSEYVGDETFFSKQESNIRGEIEKMLHGGPPVRPPAKR